MINALRADGLVVEAVELGPRRIAFVREEVVSWIDGRIAARPINDNVRPVAKAA
jgi:prophage regulatory protein